VAILGYGEMLEADPDLGDKHKRRVKLMYQAGMRSRNLVSQLLAFSRKQTMQMELLDINEVLSDFQELLEKTIREDIEVQLRLSEDLPAVRADKSQLEQVILNLAVNAQDAMPAGGKLTIETSLAELDQHYASHHMGVVPGRYLMLVVSDTGLGMDKETRDQIFEPFFTTKNIGQGTGLGLATVYGIVKQHQGTIWVYSEPGQGTTFKVYFPASDNLQAGEGKAAPVVLNETRGSETVLVIEDDDMVRDLAVSVLQNQGYNVLSAASGVQCLEMLQAYRGPFDLLLTDVIMPDLNGKELYEKVLRSYPKVRVLYMSGYTGNVISHHGVLEGGVAFLQKPFSAQGLCLKVREVLDRDE
jgi:CheY-like chemotaxis protein/two-component sensor histidine kinase